MLIHLEVHYTIIQILIGFISKHRPIKAIKVINNQSIEIVELYLEYYNFLADIPTRQFDAVYSETLETISNHYEQG